MAKAKGVAATMNIADDGSASVNVSLVDADGLPITTLTTWPSQVANPSVAASDATPGPSAFTVTPVTPPSSNSDGSFKVASVTCVQPVVQPPAQNVDFTVTVDSGLVGQTSPVSEDAGTLNIVADASAVGGFAPAIVTP